MRIEVGIAQLACDGLFDRVAYGVLDTFGFAVYAVPGHLKNLVQQQFHQPVTAHYL